MSTMLRNSTLCRHLLLRMWVLTFASQTRRLWLNLPDSNGFALCGSILSIFCCYRVLECCSCSFASCLSSLSTLASWVYTSGASWCARCGLKSTGARFAIESFFVSVLPRFSPKKRPKPVVLLGGLNKQTIASFCAI